MMRGWRDQLHSRRGIAKFGNNFIDFMSRQLTAFAWLGTLGHFNLQLLSIHQVMRGHSKTTRCHLLNIRIFGIAVRQRCKSFRILTTFPGIAFSAYAIHGNGQCLMRFFTDCPKRHGTGGKPLYNFAGGLHVFKRDRFGRPVKLKQSAKIRAPLILFIHQV